VTIIVQGIVGLLTSSYKSFILTAQFSKMEDAMATALEKWVAKQAELTQPDKIYWCNGSDEETRRLVDIGIHEETLNDEPVFRKLNDTNWPNAFFHRTHPSDVARTEHLTFICHSNKDVAGPNNNWMHPDEAKAKLTELSRGCMKGRTMYVMPYLLGHPDSPYAKASVQITDSAYVAVNMRIMTRMGDVALKHIGNSETFYRGLHSIGDLSPEHRLIMHFPEEDLVWSIGSGYGGNALLGKKCFSLRIASWQGKLDGWLAEHMLIMGIQSPQGDITYVVAALPSACGKTNLAMLESALPGYKIWIIGDDIAWLNVGPDGRLWAINPEAGLFGVAPGTSLKTNPNMIRTLKSEKFFPIIFTNTAIDKDTNEPWWEGFDGNRPKNLLDWQGKDFDPSAGVKAAHPNSRFTASIYNCPILSPEYDNPQGVPISAILFGGRRAKLVPLVMESFDWNHGVFFGARMGSETTAAAVGQQGVIRRDPMAMLPFCGYNMDDYFGHWFDMGKKLSNPPKIFSVNWFRVDEKGNYMWPGFGDNIRVLKWMIDRIKNNVRVKPTPIGLMPNVSEMDLAGANVTVEDMNKLLDVNLAEWQDEVSDIKAYLEKFGEHMPKAMWDEYHKLANAVSTS
jgi:phosphoenolpyruvate carboxykinase (GTP)